MTPPPLPSRLYWCVRASSRRPTERGRICQKVVRAKRCWVAQIREEGASTRRRNAMTSLMVERANSDIRARYLYTDGAVGAVARHVVLINIIFRIGIIRGVIIL